MEFFSKFWERLKQVKRSQVQSVLLVVVAVAAAVAGQTGNLNPNASLVLAAIAAVAASVGRALSIYTDNVGVTVTGVFVAVITPLLSYGDLLPAGALGYLSVAATALTALGRSLWGGNFPPLNSESEGQ